jgi:glycosyltransferase involved in cell wall biosynthesis
MTLLEDETPYTRPRVLVPLDDPDRSAAGAGSVLVAVPAYNEERFIGSVVHGILLQGYRCLVIDDGSSDRTAEIAAAAGAIVERHATNLGKAGALNTAFSIAREMETSMLVVMDGDWQHDPQEIRDLIRPIDDGEAEIVTGSRFLRTARGRVPSVRKMGMRVLTAASNAASGQPMTDTLSGFRAFSRPALNALSFKSTGFSVEFEMQFLTTALGLRHVEVPITARYDDPPKRNVLRYGMTALDGLIRLTARFRPLLFIGLPSVVALIAGILLGGAVIDSYQQASGVAGGLAALALALVVTGSIGLFAAIVLHVLRSISLDLESQLQAIARRPGGPRHPR